MLIKLSVESRSARTSISSMAANIRSAWFDPHQQGHLRFRNSHQAMLRRFRFPASAGNRHLARRCASTTVNPGMSKITNLDKSAGDPHLKVRDMSVFPKERIR